MRRESYLGQITGHFSTDRTRRCDFAVTNTRAQPKLDSISTTPSFHSPRQVKPPASKCQVTEVCFPCLPTVRPGRQYESWKNRWENCPIVSWHHSKLVPAKSRCSCRFPHRQKSCCWRAIIRSTSKKVAAGPRSGPARSLTFS